MTVLQEGHRLPPAGAAVYCADPGSVPSRGFGWYGGVHGSGDSGHLPSRLVAKVAADLNTGQTVLLGFESPLSVPVREYEQELGKARIGERNRPWSAGAGATIATYGMVQLTWVLRELRRKVDAPRLLVSWDEVAALQPGLYLFEAFVSGAAKSKKQESHIEDARLAVDAVWANGLPAYTGWMATDEPVLSLAGAALLHTDWPVELSVLHRPLPIVIVQA